MTKRRILVQSTSTTGIASSSSFVEQQKLTASDAAAGDFFGFGGDLGGRADSCWSVPLSTTIAEMDAGSAFVYRWNAYSSSFVEQQKLTASDAATRDLFRRICGDLGRRADCDSWCSNR